MSISGPGPEASLQSKNPGPSVSWNRHRRMTWLMLLHSKSKACPSPLTFPGGPMEMNPHSLSSKTKSLQRAIIDPATPFHAWLWRPTSSVRQLRTAPPAIPRRPKGHCLHSSKVHPSITRLAKFQMLSAAWLKLSGLLVQMPEARRRNWQFLIVTSAITIFWSHSCENRQMPSPILRFG